MRALSTKIVLIAGAFLLLAVAALTGISVYVNSSAFRGRLVAQIDAAIDGTLVVDDHRLSLLKGQLVLSDIALQNSDGEPAALIGELRLVLFWPALVWRAVQIRTLILDDIRVNVILGPQGRTNLGDALALRNPSAPKNGAAQSAWQVSVRDLQVRNGRLAFEQPAERISTVIVGLTATGRGDLQRRTFQLDLALAEARLQMPDRQEKVNNIVIAAAYTESAVQPLRLALHAPDVRVALQGRIDREHTPWQVDLSGNLDLELAALRPWLPSESAAGGRVQGTASLTGPLNDPAAAADLRWQNGSAWGFAVEEVIVKARLDARQVHIDNANLRSAWGELDLSGSVDLRPVFPKSFEKQAAGFDSVSYSVAVGARRLNISQVRRFAPDVPGIWRGRMHLEGSALAIDRAQGKASLTMNGSGVQVSPAGRPADVALTAELHWAEQLLRIVRSQATLDGHDLQVAGNLRLDSGRMDASAKGQSKHLADLGAILGIRLPRGNGTLALQAKGAWNQPVVHAELSAHDLAWDAWRFGRLRVVADLGADGIVHISPLVLDNQGSSLQGQGRLHLLQPDGQLRDDPGVQFKVALHSLDWQDFAADPPAQVRMQGSLAISGSLLHPTAELTLGTGQVVWEALQGQVKGTARWTDGRLVIPELRLSKGKSSLTLAGSATWRDEDSGRWRADPLIQAELRSDAFRVQDWMAGYKGALTFQASLKGRPATLNGTYRLEGRDLDTGVQKLSDLRLEGRFAEQTAYVDRLAASLVPGQQVQGNGWYAFDQRFEARLHAAGISLAHITALQGGRAVHGSLDMTVSAQGTLQDPTGTANLHIRAPRIGDQRWDDFNVDVRLQDSQLEAKADLNFDLSGHYRLDSGDFSVSADLEQTDLTPYLAMVADERWSGRLTGTIRATGNTDDPANMHAQVVLSQAALRYDNADLLRFDRLEATLAQGVLSMPATRLNWMQQGHLIVSAAGRLAHDLSLQADGTLPLAALAPFTDQIGDAVGNIRIAARAQGPWSEMQWHADVVLARIGFVLADWDQVLRDVNGTIRIRPEHIVVDSLSGMLDTGRFALDGQIRHAGGRPVQGQIALKAQALPIAWPDTMDLLVGADLVLKGGAGQAVLEGKVTLLEGHYYKNVRIDLRAPFAAKRRAEPQPTGWSVPQWFEAVALDVIVAHRYPLLVDNNVTRLEVVPDFKIGGTAAKPTVSGRANVSEGEVFFRRKTFTIKRGVVDFVNPYKIEPTLDIVAETQIRQWQVTLALNGTLDNLSVQLRSDPPESDSNILSLVLLGRTSAELGQGGSTATTEQMLATLVESAWGEDIKKRAGVDILEVETGAQDEDDSSERIQVTVGKKVSRRLTIKYSVEAAGSETVQRATSDYQLLENILASGFQDTAGTYGGELLFRIEFR